MIDFNKKELLLMKTQKQNKPFEQNDPTRHAPLIDRYGVFTTKFAVQSKK